MNSLQTSKEKKIKFTLDVNSMRLTSQGLGIGEREVIPRSVTQFLMAPFKSSNQQTAPDTMAPFHMALPLRLYYS